MEIEVDLEDRGVFREFVIIEQIMMITWQFQSRQCQFKCNWLIKFSSKHWCIGTDYMGEYFCSVAWVTTLIGKCHDHSWCSSMLKQLGLIARSVASRWPSVWFQGITDTGLLMNCILSEGIYWWDEKFCDMANTFQMFVVVDVMPFLGAIGNWLGMR